MSTLRLHERFSLVLGLLQLSSSLLPWRGLSDMASRHLLVLLFPPVQLKAHALEKRKRFCRLQRRETKARSPLSRTFLSG